MKTFLNRVIPLLLSITLGMALSWVSIYAFWFGVWTFHTLPAARAFDAVGSFILQPAHWIYQLAGVDQSSIFLDPSLFAKINGLIIGVIIYSVFRAFMRHREATRIVQQSPAKGERMEAKVG